MKDKDCPNQSDGDTEKRSYNQKSGDCPDGSIEKQRPTAQSGWPRNDVPRSAKPSVRLKSRPKFQNRPITHHDPGNIARGRPSQTSRHAAHDHAARAGKQASRPRNPFAYHGRCIRPSRENVPRPAEKHRPNLHPPTTPADRESIRPDRSDSATTRLSGRSSRPTVPTPRSTRSPFEAHFIFSSPA
ncbi:unnamed protein product [Microthlaspi erraticum]|uniref:Uncharacterized protein n=1 Tax=Microthlaspi erraticum TaxID=1685480 RepID=A0A6D2KTA1_9BRAS|nr:unnamed protein product [Microthlaspi erraticum]